MFTESFTGSFHDPLRRIYVPAVRVVAEDGCRDAGSLVGNRVLRGFVGCGMPVCRIEEGGWLLLDFGRELTGGVRLVTGGAMKEARVRLRFGESVSEAMGQPDMDHAVHDVELPLRAYSAVDFGGTGFRFLRLDAVSGAPELHNVIARAEYLPLERIGRFRSSEERIDRIFDTCAHTLHLNMQDCILDGVKRDRLPWGGDMHPETSGILRIFGAVPEIGDTLERLCKETAAGKFVNGHIENPLWLLWTIRDLWFYGGDGGVPEVFADFVTDSVERYRAMIREDGAVEFPGRLFLDWGSSGEPAAVHAGVCALLVLAFRGARELYRELGLDPAPVDGALELLARRVPDPVGNKRAAALQHLAGIADRRAVLEDEPLRKVGTFLGYYILLAKENRAALELIRKFWGGMLDMGATSFWEDFDLDWLRGAPTRIDELPVAGRPDIHADFGAYCYKGLRHSLCHGWAAGPAAWISRRILGVEPLAPGFSVLRFAPDLCGLEYAEGSVPTPRGAVRVRLEAGKKPEIAVPGGVEVEFGTDGKNIFP